MIRLRHMVRLGPSAGEISGLRADDEVTFAPMDSLADGLGGLDASTTRPLSEVINGSYNYFADGDLLLAKVTPCFENGKKAIALGLVNGVGFATSEVHVIRPDTRKINAGFLRYLLCSEPFRAEGMRSMTGAGGLRRVSERAILDHRPSVTDLATQKVIAAFLDAETARIDALIEKKERLAERLEEKRRAEQAFFTTRGLNPDVEMRSVELPMLPSAPAHWRVRRLARVFRESSEMGGDALPVLSVSINWGISDRELDDEDRHRVVNHIEDRSAYKRVRIGDLVYNMMRAWQGAFGVSKVDGLVSPAYVVARPIEALHAPYFEPLLRTPMWIEEFRRASRGIADFRQRLYWEHFRQVAILLPPLGEQKAIADEIERRATSIEAALAPLQASIDRLREFRAALITAAVTGQIDPADWRRRGEGDRRLDRIEEEISM